MKTFGVLVLVSIFLAIVVSIASDKPDSRSPEARAADEARWDTDLGGAVTLRKMMRDPDSFKTAQVLEMPDGTVCYRYRSRDGFGGMDTGNAMVYRDRLVTETSIGFSDLYGAECAGKGGVDRSPEVNEAIKMIAARE